jgi:hypothetical protein
MQIEEIKAYKDVATGKVFESPETLADFQDEQRKAAETAARIDVIRARLTALRLEVLAKVETPDQLALRVREAYQETLDLLHELVELRGIKRTKTQQRTKIEVVKVEAWNFAFRPTREMEYKPNSGVVMSCYLRVTLSSDPYGKLFCEEMPDLDFKTVTGIRTYSGGASDEDGMYVMRYSVYTPLTNLPLMQPRVLKLVEMSEAESKHSRALQMAQLDAFNQDPAVLAISSELAAAQRTLDAAIEARDAVRTRLDQKGEEIAAAVAQAMPFEQKAEHDEAQLGFETVEEEWETVRFYL